MTEVPARHLRRSTTTPRRVLALFLVLHGVAHLVGAQAAFAAGAQGIGYLGDAWKATGATLVALGTIWALLAAGFAVAAALLWLPPLDPEQGLWSFRLGRFGRGRSPAIARLFQ